MPGIDQQSNARAGLRDGFIHLLRVPVSPASLNISMEKVVGYGVQHHPGGLRSRCIIKENELLLQSRKSGANLCYGECCHGPNDIPGDASDPGEAFVFCSKHRSDLNYS